MVSENIAAEIFKRHPELKKGLTSRQLRVIRKVIVEVAELSSRQTLTSEETERLLRRRVPDAGKPSAALRAYRKRLDLTQRELAERSGIQQPHIAAMESGRRPVGLAAAKKLGLALGVNYRKLV